MNSLHTPYSVPNRARLERAVRRKQTFTPFLTFANVVENYLKFTFTPGILLQLMDAIVESVPPISFEH